MALECHRIYAVLALHKSENKWICIEYIILLFIQIEDNFLMPALLFLSFALAHWFFSVSFCQQCRENDAHYLHLNEQQQPSK